MEQQDPVSSSLQGEVLPDQVSALIHLVEMWALEPAVLSVLRLVVEGALLLRAQLSLEQVVCQAWASCSLVALLQASVEQQLWACILF